MATKKDNLPLTLDQDNDSTGTITYANEVIAIIAGVAANEVEGVAGMCSGGGITDVFGRNKNITRGVKVELGTEEAAVDIYLIIEYGTPIQTAASNVQENVRKHKTTGGIIQMLLVTERQFERMEIVVGEAQHTVIDSDERLIIL